MQVFELFPFWKELDLLELHLEETDPVVDTWVICELPVTFTGLPKPMYLQEALVSGRLDRFRGKIRTLRCSVVPEGPHPIVDWFQRGQLARGIADSKPDDLIILTDLDEIPNRDYLASLRKTPLEHPVVLSSFLYYFTPTWQAKSRWNGPIVTPRSCLGASPDTQRLRDMRNNLPRIEDSAWHFSWLGTEAQILEKLDAVDIERESAIYGGGIVSPPRTLEYVSECRNLGLDLFGRGQLQKAPLSPGLQHPHEIVPWLDRFPQYQSVQHPEVPA